MPILAALLLLAAGRVDSPVSIVVHADQPAHPISRDLFGVFFEEINHAGDGGLNPQLVRNFNFREPLVDGATPGWTRMSTPDAGTVILGRGGMILTRTTAGSSVLGASNGGYWGIPTTAGVALRFGIECFSGAGTPIALRLVAPDGKEIGRAAAIPSATYSMVRGTIEPTASTSGAHLEVDLEQAGQVNIRSVSLVPEKTFKGHGLRPDLAGLVNALHPAFVRFPGGCYVEGGDYLADRFKWETTLTPPAERPGHFNETWGYWSSDGLGFHEYLQWCEDMGAQALFVVNCGFSHKETVAMKDLDPYLLSTFDALEYALGPVTSRFGALRARRGHPKPFPLKFLEIGNENGQGWPTGGSPADYAAHYKFFADKIKEKYPGLVLIADTRAAKDAQCVDDHFYSSPDWFWRNSGIYDHAARTGPKVYVGEYAVTSDCGKGNLRAALGEAAFMTGLERNSDLVEMASYAPLFVNVNNRAWNPDAICFDGEQSYGTPSYYVQQVFAENRGDTFLPADYPILDVADTFTGSVGLGTWETSAEYKDVRVSAGGKTLYNSDFVTRASEWQPGQGTWSVEDSAYRQSSSAQDAVSLLQAPALDNLGDCTIRVKARKLGGNEGFLLLFHAANGKYLWWNVGGWGDHETGVEASSGSSRYGVGRRVPFTVETGRWYDFRIVTHGNDMSLFADGQLVQHVRLTGSPTLAVSASEVAANGDIILKVVNGAEVDRDATVQLTGLAEGPLSGTATTLTAGSQNDENSFADPTKVAPHTAPVSLQGSTFRYDFPARSVTVLRVHRPS